MFDPVSTYRIQFNKDFTLSQLRKLVPYLEKLGVSTIYASPIFEAVPGSTHGYDCTSPERINPEIGTEEEFFELVADMQKIGIGWLQDIVPNHMAYHINNPWMEDVLKEGKGSQYASYFDVDWEAGKLMCPFLNAPAGQCIEDGSLKIGLHKNKPVLAYFDNFFPLNAESIVELQQQYDMESGLETINENKGLLKNIAGKQHYALCHWQETNSCINYRRFFLVNSLICLNIHDENVFEHYHRYIKTLVDKGVFQGLRVDHIDGLYDPGQYLERLRRLAGENAYIVTEKILHINEHMPAGWPVQGNTGYDFLALSNNLFTYQPNREKFVNYYKQIDNRPPQDQVFEKKAHILYDYMAGELDNLCRLFLDIRGQHHDVDAIKKAIADMLIHLPVYRFYTGQVPLRMVEQDQVQKVLDSIKKRKPELSAALDALAMTLLDPQPGQYDKVLHFYRRCMQFSGPLTAKGVEDTLMYTYNAFLCHNEVGDNPASFGISPAGFHERMLQRRRSWPYSINASATHDTKRGEDARARLNVLSEMPGEWFEAVNEWEEIARQIGDDIPGSNERYHIYQSLIAAYPVKDKGDDNSVFLKRTQDYFQKAIREAKVHTNWGVPNEAYEQSFKKFIDKLLEASGAFTQHFSSFYAKIADYGIINSLAQTILKFTCPGVPDTYQGCESWDLSFVDPDNRKPVDYNAHAAKLEQLRGDAIDMQQLWEDRHSGKIKIWLVNRLLQLRKKVPGIFSQGQYVPLQVTGKHAQHVFAFARVHQGCWYIIVIPLYMAVLNKNNTLDISQIDWEDTKVLLPGSAPAVEQDVLQDEKVATNGGIAVKDIFKTLPFSILKAGDTHNKRQAGILLPVFSLPSAYGIGDIGISARKFADQLNAAGQGIWQLLPVNPTDSSVAYSPYNAMSSIAGWHLLIDPEWLAQHGLLTGDELKEHHLPSADKVDYAGAEQAKNKLFDLAWARFSTDDDQALKPAFDSFCSEEQDWLEDYADYMVLSNMYGKAWNKWPEQYRHRDKEAMQRLHHDKKAELSKIQWLQFIFFRQWRELKNYCTLLGIQLFGDLPFYMSLNSADVWANASMFSLDGEGNIAMSAGVPPDYFSEVGQLWHMPTYRWDVLKDNNYKWWAQRIGKNIELFDLLRIDHFRAFSEYWEVPAGEKNAVNGEWKEGVGAGFFSQMHERFGKLPLVAEDLGDNMQRVYELRDEVNLPGMKVLQFAFGDNMYTAVDAPHNFSSNCIVYTGTHDNNTVKGWYRNDMNDDDRARLAEYLDKTITEAGVHKDLSRLAYSTVARIAILPVQDVLGLDETARMNLPGSNEGNWLWRLMPGQFSAGHMEWLKDMARRYNRL